MYNKKRHSEKIQMKKTYVFVLGAAVPGFKGAETKETGYILCVDQLEALSAAKKWIEMDNVTGFAIGRLSTIPYNQSHSGTHTRI